MSSGGENKGGCAKSTAAYQSLSLLPCDQFSDTPSIYSLQPIGSSFSENLSLTAAMNTLVFAPHTRDPLFYFHSIQQQRLCQSATVQLLQFTYQCNSGQLTQPPQLVQQRNSMECIHVQATVAENTPLCQFAIRTYIEMQNVPDHFHQPCHLQECNDCFWFSMKRVEKGSFDV